MSRLKRFWGQPNTSYRNFVIVYTILALNFILPAISYYADPDAATSSAYGIGSILGADRSASEDSYIWWILGAGNVMTLGVMCALLLVNLRRFYPILPALVTLKGLSSLGFLAVYVAGPHNPAFLAFGLFDGLTVIVMIWFAVRAKRAVDRDPFELVPRPLDGRRLLSMGPKSRKRAGIVAQSILPTDFDREPTQEDGNSSVAELVAAQIECAPLSTGVGAMLLFRTVHASPLLVIGRARALSNLSRSERDRYLQRLEGHRIYAVRQAYQSLKALISLAILGQPAVQDRLGAYRSDAARARRPSH